MAYEPRGGRREYSVGGKDVRGEKMERVRDRQRREEGKEEAKEGVVW